MHCENINSTSNCPIKQERDNQKWKKEWEEALVKWGIANLKIDEVKKESLGDCYGWEGVPIIPISAWNTLKEHPEIINLTSPSPPPSLLPLTPPSSPLYNPYSPLTHPTPLLGFEDLVSDFDSVTSSYSSLGNVGDIELNGG